MRLEVRSQNAVSNSKTLSTVTREASGWAQPGIKARSLVGRQAHRGQLK